MVWVTLYVDWRDQNRLPTDRAIVEFERTTIQCGDHETVVAA